MRTFKVHRTADFSGVSGLGDVAEGVEFDTGKVVICWMTKYHSIGIFDTLHELEAIHGHNGASKVVWDDKETS